MTDRKSPRTLVHLFFRHFFVCPFFVLTHSYSAEVPDGLQARVLIEELNCTACHASTASLANKTAPRLSDVGSRVNPAYLESFIRDPLRTKPGATMPDVLGGNDKAVTASELTHFLLSLKKPTFDLQPIDAVAAKQGQTLFHARGCAACHSPRDEKGTELMPSNSVPLGALEKKYSVKSLRAFLRNPHASRPSGRMPDMRLTDRDIECISHFLLRETKVPGHLAYTMYRGNVWEGIDNAEVQAERAGLVDDFALDQFGKVQQHTAIRYEGWLNIERAGSYTFYFEFNGGSLKLDGTSIVELAPTDRRGVKKAQGKVTLAAGWHSMDLIYYHTGREAKFNFEMEGPEFKRQPIPSSLLSISDKPIAAFEPLKVDAALAARGREHFGKMGCAKCHDDLGIQSAPATPFAKLDPTRGCLSATAGAWPKFDLNIKQRELIAKALPQIEKQSLTDAQQIQKTLVTFNCIACHERSGLGGIASERNALFTGTAPALGDQGRLPPPLTGVGAKLTPEWITQVMLRGQRQRSYLDAAMPQFGEANVGHLVPLFAKVDKLEDVPIPKIANLQESKNAGYEMAGTTGLSCIACHDFHGEKSAAGALDLVHVTERVQKSWFHLYMRQPQRFHPTVIMPSYWPGGQSMKKDLLGGDSSQQIEALWAYLADGTRAKKPLGLAREAKALTVTDVAELCRGRGPAGYRGIGVGYPERINLAWDSEQMSLRELWKGDFVNVDFGSFQPRGTDRLTFAPGIPFHALKSLEDNWPAKGKADHGFPQNQGYQFRGYHLDKLRRPTFHYEYGTVKVSEFFEDIRNADGKAFFKRTLTFDAPSEQPPFYFRAASGKKVASSSTRKFDIDQLQLRITSDHTGLIREGDPAEVLIPLTLPKGTSTLTLEYQW